MLNSNMSNIQNALNTILVKYPKAITNDKLFNSLIADLLPNDNLARNLFFLSVKENIPYNILKQKQITKTYISVLEKKIVNTCGCDINVASEIISLWISSIKACNISLNDLENDTEFNKINEPSMNNNILPKDISELREAMEQLPSFKNESYRNSFEGFMKKIEQIDAFAQVKKYRVVFIGEPGKGKTTAICNWLNLLKKNKIREKRVDEISLLATASGRTTVAEVHIRQNFTKSSISIKHMPIYKQEEYIREYCKYYYSICKGNTNLSDDNTSTDNQENANVLLEIDRVVRNMACLENIPSGTSQKKYRKKKKNL